MNKYMLGLLVLGAAAVSTPAYAQINIEVSAQTKTYFGFAHQDDSASDVRSTDMLRESELHFNAEGVTDQQLTYGFHAELEADGGDDTNTLEQSYLYLSNTSGKLELGSPDSSVYKLQVSAPSADSNVDGIRQLINPVNYAADDAIGATNDIAATGNADGFDYDQNFAGYDEKVSYFTPKWSGFQAGVSYTFDREDNNSSSGLEGFNSDNDADEIGSVYDVAIRYEGEISGVGIKTGAGYTYGELEEDSGAGLDDYQEYNVAIDLDISDFGVGAVYTANNNGLDSNDSDETIVVGVDYTMGPYKFGASYYDRDDEAAGVLNTATAGVETKRYTGGVVYEVVDGLDFRGSVSFIENDVAASAGNDTEATALMLGVDVSF